MKKIVLFSVLAINFAFGQKSQSERLDSLFTALHQKEKFNGNVLIADKGKVIYEKSFGLAERENQRKLNANSVFELASVSKTFTAMGIVLLEKQGKLKYDDPIEKYIPELAFYGKITLRNLLNHTSGLPDYMELFEEKWDKTKFATNQDIVKEFAKHQPKLLFPIGEKYEYSNTGYALLGLIIEKVSKQTFGDFLAKNIFKPLKMNASLVYRGKYKPQKIDNYAFSYVGNDLQNALHLGKEHYTYYLDGIVGDGMVNSTTSDLLKWDRALYRNQFINDKDREIIFKSVKTNNGEETRYGFGWQVANSKKYGKIASHTGGWMGYVTLIERHLDKDKTIIMLQNYNTPKTAIPRQEVRKILYNEALEPEKELVAITPTPEQLKAYEGVYSSEKFPLKIKIVTNGNELTAQADGQPNISLSAFENHTFVFEPANIKLIFNTAENTMKFSQGGMSLEMKREK